MRRSIILGAIAVLMFAVPVSAADPTYRATMAGPGPTGTVTVATSGASGTLKWNLAHIARNSLLTVTIRGGTCADLSSLIVRARWEARFVNGASVQTRVLESSWVTSFNRSWSSRGGDVAIVTNAGHTECQALARD